MKGEIFRACFTEVLTASERARRLRLEIAPRTSALVLLALVVLLLSESERRSAIADVAPAQRIFEEKSGAGTNSAAPRTERRQQAAPQNSCCHATIRSFHCPSYRCCTSSALRAPSSVLIASSPSLPHSFLLAPAHTPPVMPSMESLAAHNLRPSRVKKARKFFDSADYYIGLSDTSKATYNYVPHPVVFKGAPTAAAAASPVSTMTAPASENTNTVNTDTAATNATAAAAPTTTTTTNAVAVAAATTTQRAPAKRSARKFFDSADYYSKVSVAGKAAYNYVPHPVVFKDLSGTAIPTLASAGENTSSAASTASSDAAQPILLPLDDDAGTHGEQSYASPSAVPPSASYVARKALQRHLKGRIHFDSAEWALGLTTNNTNNTANNNGC